MDTRELSTSEEETKGAVAYRPPELIVIGPATRLLQGYINNRLRECSNDLFEYDPCNH